MLIRVTFVCLLFSPECQFKTNRLNLVQEITNWKNFTSGTIDEIWLREIRLGKPKLRKIGFTFCWSWRNGIISLRYVFKYFNANNFPSLLLCSLPLTVTLQMCAFSRNYTNSSKGKSKEIKIEYFYRIW